MLRRRPPRLRRDGRHQPAVALRAAGATRSGRRSRRCWPSSTRSSPRSNTVRYELRDAAARVDSARQSFTIIDQDLLAQARRSLEATQAAYAAGQGDAVGAARRACGRTCRCGSSACARWRSWRRARRISSAPRARWRWKEERDERARADDDHRRDPGRRAVARGPAARRARRCRSSAGCSCHRPRWSPSVRSPSYAGVHVGGGDGRVVRRQLYTCPMHPSIVQDHPGECPICSMTLVPKPDDAARDGRSAETARRDAEAGRPGPVGGRPQPERIQLIGMRTAHGQARGDRGRAAHGGRRSPPNERGLAQINTPLRRLDPEAAGLRDRRARAARPGAGDDLQPRRPAGRAGAAGRRAAGTRGRGRRQADPRARRVHGRAGRQTPAAAWSCSGSPARRSTRCCARARRAEAIAIRSPVDGYVVGKSAVAGVAVQPGTVLFEVADLSQVWVTADIYEQDISRIRVGQTARLELSAFPGESHAGQGAVHLPGARLAGAGRCACGSSSRTGPIATARACAPACTAPSTSTCRATTGLLVAGRGGRRHRRDALPVRREGGRPLRAARW